MLPGAVRQRQHAKTLGFPFVIRVAGFKQALSECLLELADGLIETISRRFATAHHPLAAPENKVQ
ncbi:MAG: hypothetical protein EBU28_11145 [Gammaproteobacteria bacterium]|nr:hypothetical protein [Gammaproteobacteria bacterium]